MRPRASGAASGGPWARYVPDSQAPWDLRRVVHLHRRAGFAATWAEIQRDLKDGPEASINRLLEGRSRSHGVPADFATFADRLADLALAAPEPNRLEGWWVSLWLQPRRSGFDPFSQEMRMTWPRQGWPTASWYVVDHISPGEL
jgi:hypothetical protein